MRAALCDANGLSVVDDMSIEEPRSGEVLVKVHHCGICHSDLSILDGAGGGAPVVLGHEAAGVVEAVGPNVTSLVPGDAVLLTPLASCGSCYWCVRGQPTQCEHAMAFLTGLRPDGTSPLSRYGDVVQRGLGVGGWADFTVVSEHAAVRLDPDTPLGVACVIGCAAQTGVGAVFNTARVPPGASVLVTGLGGIGQAVVQGARIAGSDRIIVSDPVAGRREMALQLGATDALDPDSVDVIAEVHRRTDGRGVDYAFEAAGVAALTELCFNATRNGGTTVVVGTDASMASVSLMPVLIATFGKKILGSLLGDCHPQRDIPRLVRLWRRGSLDLDAMVSHRLDLADVATGVDRLRSADGIRTVLDIRG